MVYPEVVAEDVTPQFGEGISLQITCCTLCHYGFPDFDIIVASCSHMFHPWCAWAVFSKSAKCCDSQCKGEINLNWHQSFGWRCKDPKMMEQENTVGDEEDNQRLLAERASKYEVECPSVGNVP